MLPSQDEEYTAEIVKADAATEAFMASSTELIDEANVEIVTEATDLEAGATIFQRQCAVCHAADGGGGVGPNFTDEYWIHGGDIKDLFKTIKYGVPEKGMISWQAQLNPSEMRSVASYILTLVGTTSANPKEPQGELYVPGEASADSTLTE